MIIDVSRHNGPIDWPRVRGEGGVTCAIIRATLGSTGVDDHYALNWREAGWAGIPQRGMYHYVISGAPAAAQLANILATTGGDLRPAVYRWLKHRKPVGEELDLRKATKT